MTLWKKTMPPSQFERFLRDNDLPMTMLDQLTSVYQPIADFIVESNRERNDRVFGINGSQGSGKSTLCRVLQWLLHRRGRRAAILSIDDLYLDQGRRAELARQVHPLLETRGVPGTHDVALGIDTLDALRDRRAVALPRFDKANDDPCPRHRWPIQTKPVDVVLFEGWCVASLPQAEADLETPVNGLEAREDGDGHWRRYVNDRLAGPYRGLFRRIDRLILLEVADFSWVYGWRKKQEDRLRQRQTGSRIMDDRTLARFIEHFERITRHNAETLPYLADIRLLLDQSQRIERHLIR
uniref:D-glycerate 3-kinase n=1 Tax=Candidatus Kentrum sp. LFY TaxID=2126342 RepID=A0A450X4E4_9GAMM|nr:MAG: D-glycerate 3-kinase [Candidatus Kentron sp. LFY]